MIGLESAVAVYQREKTEKSFREVLSLSMDIFGLWYRNVQRFTNFDRQQLLSEFQLLVLRTVNKYDDMQAHKWNGYECYLWAAAKKLDFFLRRGSRRRLDSLPEGYDAPDPKSRHDTDLCDTLDTVNTCLSLEEQSIVRLRAMGENSDEIRKKLKMTDYFYREKVRQIKSNEQLNTLFSSIK